MPNKKTYKIQLDATFSSFNGQRCVKYTDINYEKIYFIVRWGICYDVGSDAEGVKLHLK
jgi:hypothetical protein